MNGFQTCSPLELQENFWKLLEKDWALLCAGDQNKHNAMTVSWGGTGVLWNLPVAFCFVRPQRFTYGILEQDSHFTLSFFGDGYREALNLCGSKSGRELDKLQAAGLDALELEDGGMGIAQARLILSCRKLYADNLKPEGFLMPDLIAKNYPNQDFHRMYIGEITNCYIAR